MTDVVIPRSYRVKYRRWKCYTHKNYAQTWMNYTEYLWSTQWAKRTNWVTYFTDDRSYSSEGTLKWIEGNQPSSKLIIIDHWRVDSLRIYFDDVIHIYGWVYLTISVVNQKGLCLRYNYSSDQQPISETNSQALDGNL